jgi:hypothetical protein
LDDDPGADVDQAVITSLRARIDTLTHQREDQTEALRVTTAELRRYQRTLTMLTGETVFYKGPNQQRMDGRSAGREPLRARVLFVLQSVGKPMSYKDVAAHKLVGGYAVDSIRTALSELHGEGLVRPVGRSTPKAGGAQRWEPAQEPERGKRKDPNERPRE